MAEDRWNRASVIVSVVTAIVGGTYAAVHYIEVVPARDRASKAETRASECETKLASKDQEPSTLMDQLTKANSKAQLAEQGLAEANQKLKECLSRPEPVAPDGTAGDNPLVACQATVAGLKQQLSDSDGDRREVQSRLDECWNRCKQVTPRNFSLRKGQRQVATYKGSEYGITFVEWLDRDSTDVTILIDKVGEQSASVRARVGRPTPFHLAGLRLVAELTYAERVNDRVGLRLEEAE